MTKFGGELEKRHTRAIHQIPSFFNRAAGHAQNERTALKRPNNRDPYPRAVRMSNIARRATSLMRYVTLGAGCRGFALTWQNHENANGCIMSIHNQTMPFFELAYLHLTRAARNSMIGARTSVGRGAGDGPGRGCGRRRRAFCLPRDWRHAGPPGRPLHPHRLARVGRRRGRERGGRATPPPATHALPPSQRIRHLSALGRRRTAGRRPFDRVRPLLFVPHHRRADRRLPRRPRRHPPRGSAGGDRRHPDSRLGPGAGGREATRRARVDGRAAARGPRRRPPPTARRAPHAGAGRAESGHIDVGARAR